MILSAMLYVYVADNESGVVEYASQLSNDVSSGYNRVDYNVHKVAIVIKRMAARDARAIINVSGI